MAMSGIVRVGRSDTQCSPTAVAGAGAWVLSLAARVSWASLSGARVALSASAILRVFRSCSLACPGSLGGCKIMKDAGCCLFYLHVEGQPDVQALAGTQRHVGGVTEQRAEMKRKQASK
jgi:hypothetical protein